MVSLIDIYNIKESTFLKEQDFVSKQVDLNPVTGQITWDIEYKTDLERTYKEIDEAVKRLQDLVSQEEDQEARKLLIMAKNLRNKFARYKNKLNETKNLIKPLCKKSFVHDDNVSNLLNYYELVNELKSIHG